jgi:integrase
LANETEVRDGKIKPKRIFLSLGTEDWTAAEKEVGRLYDRGSIPPLEAAAPVIDNGAVTVRYAGERYLESRTGASLDPIERGTLEHYRSLIDQRLIPYCEKAKITLIRDFENRDVCSKFTESWRQMRRNIGAVLAMSTRKTELQRFRTFLKFCVDNGWMEKSGAEGIKTRKKTTSAEEERYGLELAEYQRMLDAPDSPDLTAQENQETRVATELMRWAGLRISDAHKFNSSEIVRNEKGDGWNAEFIQKKTKKRCISPLPSHVVEALTALPGRTERGKKFFFTCSYTALRMRVHTLAERAQKEVRFAHPFAPHCLRHTFAIQHFNEGTPVELVSRWLGHESTAVTIKHYHNWISSTRELAEDVSRDANARMLAKLAALKDQTKTDLTNSSATPLGTK